MECGAEDQPCLASRADHRATLPGSRHVMSYFEADFAVAQGGRKNAPTHTPWKGPDSIESDVVVKLRHRQQLMGCGFKLRTRSGIAMRHGLLHRRGWNPRRWQVDTVLAQVFRNVACYVGTLHRDAEMHGGRPAF